jgi:predicted Zn-dependent peptidase
MTMDPRKLTFDRLAVQPRPTERVMLRNGIAVHLLEDRSLPVIQVEALVRTGTVFDPADKAGVASMMATAMRLGGSTAVAGDALDEELDFLGAELDGGSDDDMFRLKAWTLSRHLPRVLELLAGVLRQPAFPADKVELTRARELELISRRWDQPPSVASLMFRQAVYGPDSPWGRLGGAAQAKAVTREDLGAMHARFFAPKATILAVAGDFKATEMVAALDAVLGDWTATPGDQPVIPAAAPAGPGGVAFIPRDIGQLNFRIGHLGVTLLDPDWFALKLMDMILGNGSFNSRLFKDIRTKRGLAYSVFSRMSGRAYVPGTFQVGGETKYETAGEALTAILKHVRDLRTTEVTAAEIKLAKEQLDHGLAFEFQSGWETVRRQAVYEYYGLRANWLLHERERVLAVTAKDIRRAAEAHCFPDRAIIVAVGDPAKCRETLATFGPIRDVVLPA